MWSAYNSRSLESPLNLQFLSSPHVNKGKVSITIHHDILWLKIPINNLIAMHMLYHNQDLTDQESSIFWGKSLYFGDNIEKVLAFYQIHDEVDEVAIFYELVEVDYEWRFRDGS